MHGVMGLVTLVLGYVAEVDISSVHHSGADDADGSNGPPGSCPA